MKTLRRAGRTSRGMARPRGSTRAGFSLIEVMVALLVLGVGVVGVAEGIGTALRSSREARLQTAAALYAAGVVETLRAEGFLTDGSVDGDCPAGLEAFRWRRTLSRTGLEGLHEVEVAIEDRRTGKPVYELRTQLFEIPSESPVRDREREREREAGARRREQRGGGR